MISPIVGINEHTVGPRGSKTYRRTTVVCGLSVDGHPVVVHEQTEPLAPELRKEAFFVWEQSADLREAAGSPTAMHPQDWDRKAAAHWPGHPSIDSVLASRGYDEDGSIRS